MPVGRGGGVHSVEVEGRKNREPATSSLRLMFSGISCSSNANT